MDIAIRQQGNVILPDLENATISVDKPTAYDDETVTVTVTPDKHYRVQKGFPTVNGEPIEGNTFTMPAGDAYHQRSDRKKRQSWMSLNYVIGVGEQMK